MKAKDRIAVLAYLGRTIKSFLCGAVCEHSQELEKAIALSCKENLWFTKENCKLALEGIVQMLSEKELHDWTSRYSSVAKKKKVVCVMAGNIPAVGFHDMLCVLLSGHCFVGKSSGKDKYLLPAIAQILCYTAPEMQKQVSFVEQLPQNDYDAVIATGSNNTARYFEQYFASKPHIIRKGRSSVAILTGEETSEQLQALADDVFMYFGLGCRNVSKLYLPLNYDVKKLLPYFEKYARLQLHQKWMNNYNYNRSIMLVDKTPFFETDFALFVERQALLSPIGVVYYEFYENTKAVLEFCEQHKEELQCVVSSLPGEGMLSMGTAQYPALDDYADGIDTMTFLSNI